MGDKLYVGLHNHSVFSIADATSPIADIARRCKELGMDAIAITEHGSLSSWLQFKTACKKYNIKGILGLEAYFVDDVNEVYVLNEEISVLQESIKKLNKSKTKADKKAVTKLNDNLLALQEKRNILKKYNHIILLAKNYEGCMNLIKIHNASVIDGIYYKPRISWATLEQYKGGIIASTACLGGRISKLLANDDIITAKNAVARFKNIFGQDNFYLELQLHDIPLQTEVNAKMIKLSEATNTPCIINLDSHFLDEGGHRSRELIRKLDKDPDESDNDVHLKDLFIKNEDMILTSWTKYMPGVSPQILADAILNNRKIADSIENFELDTSLKFPIFDTHGATQEDFLIKNAWKGLKAKNLHTNPVYLERLKLELNTVNPLGFASYFNIVADIIKDAKTYQSVGCGRGSVSGSLLAYVLGITEIDPIKFELYFERFLSKEKSIQPPTFGFNNIEQITLDYKKITDEIKHDHTCICNHAHS